jgi:hypothetical protein
VWKSDRPSQARDSTSTSVLPFDGCSIPGTGDSTVIPRGQYATLAKGPLPPIQTAFAHFRFARCKLSTMLTPQTVSPFHTPRG